jgi:hypothetical protein
MRFIFDLDHTTIDASHRGAFDSQGRGCLETWKRLSTPENIAKDRTLPLADQWRRLLRKGATITVCTSRMMTEADFAMLRSHGLHWHEMLSRQYDDEPTAEMKRRLLGELSGGWDAVRSNSVMFDDDKSVIDLLTRDGLRVYDAVSVNDWLRS